MYSVWWSLIGIAITCIVLVDALWTTLTVRGAGPLSTVIAGTTGRTAMRGPSWIAENASMVALSTSFLTWGLLLWSGWTAIFCGSSAAVVTSANSAPAGFVDRVYFSGYTLTTLGIGDLVPGGGVWQVATVIAAANGFAVLTLCVSYTFSVITALNTRRALGSAVFHLGGSPEEIVALLRYGGSHALSTQLLNLADKLETSAMQTDAYPVLDYTHVGDAERSFSLAVVSLGEVSLLLEHALERESTLPAAVWRPLRGAVDLLIREKYSISAPAESPQPELPNLKRLEEVGLRLRPDAGAAFRNPKVHEMRVRWARWLCWHGRDWACLRSERQA